MRFVSYTQFGVLRRETGEGKELLLLACPGCGEVGPLDDDQFHGRVSVDHASHGCPVGYHEKHDFWAASEEAGWEKA